MFRKAMTIVSAVLIASVAGAQQEGKPYRATQKDTDKGIEMVNTLIKMRINLAKMHVKPKVPIGEETARKVCIAVAEKAESIQEENRVNGNKIYVIRFVSEMPRNPANAADDNERGILKFFDESREKTEHWHGVEIDDKQYYSYMKPIFAEKSCLACHGEGKRVPAFIKKKYPNDKSFGFKEGDLMGAVAVYTWKGF